MMDQVDYGPSMPPKERMKRLSEISSTIEVDYNIPARRYYRSGLEMARMANVYLEENNLEAAYILYMRFMTLFIEKIRNHPLLKDVPKDDQRANWNKLKEIIPRTESIKANLVKKFQVEHERYLSEKEKQQQELKQSIKEEDKNKHNADNLHVKNDMCTGNLIKSVPSLPADCFMYNSLDDKPRVSLGVSNLSTPGIDRTTKPSYSFDTNSFSALRTVIIPSRMMLQFLKLAEKNTVNNVETCGILAGKLEHNRLVITHLLVPKQYGTSDSCSTDNEEELFSYQDEHDLITLGWIHTHPSQTAFLSSVDLHTHCSYQLMMAEAIAIVCAPKYSQTGVFCLTADYGLNFIANCKQKGFHPHPTDPPLFTEANHCELQQNAPVIVLDLR